MSNNFKEYLVNIKAFVFDIDGVLTNNMMYCFENGEQIRAFNVKDGFAMRYAISKKYPIGIISAGKNNAGAIKRLQYLEINDIYSGSFNKLEALTDFSKKHNIDYKNILYMGDDIPDFPVMKKVGMPTCPNNAAHEIKQLAKYISHINGGEGCVRDVIEQVMRVQGQWVNINDEKFDI